MVAPWSYGFGHQVHVSRQDREEESRVGGCPVPQHHTGPPRKQRHLAVRNLHSLGSGGTHPLPELPSCLRSSRAVSVPAASGDDILQG